MFYSNLIFALPAVFHLATATIADDLAQMTVSIEGASGMLNSTLNNSMAVNTSSMVQSITWEIGAAIANLPSYNLTTSPSTPESDNLTDCYDVPYFSYADAVLTLSEVLIRRGQIVHAELNLPVYNALQGLYNVIQTYGFQLGNYGQISRSATIRTLTVGNSIIDAESIWANNVTTTSTTQRKQKRAAFVG